MTERLQALGIKCLTWLATVMLALVALVIALLAYHIDGNGRVPAGDALGLTALLLSFREVIATIRAFPDAAARIAATDKLAASTPVGQPAVEPAAGEAA